MRVWHFYGKVVSLTFSDILVAIVLNLYFCVCGKYLAMAGRFEGAWAGRYVRVCRCDAET